MYRNRWFDRLLEVNPVDLSDPAKPRVKNRAQRRWEATQTRKHGDGRPRGGIVVSPLFESEPAEDDD